MIPDNKSYERYQRQTILKEFGVAGQQKLLQSKVLVIGAGGLGCPALQYLVAAGVGNIGIADDDVVSLTNLHRQPLYTTNDIGLSKAVTAKNILNRMNPDIDIKIYRQRITTENALAIIGVYDVVIDGTDNFATRYLVNDACVLMNKPLIYGAVSQFEGQVAIFNCTNKNGDTPVNYRDLFPQPPLPGEVLNCEVAGVLGVLPGIIGTMQANETIKLIVGFGQPLINRLFTYHTLSNRTYEITLAAKESARLQIPATADEFQQMDYDWFCGIGKAGFEIDAAEFDHFQKRGNIAIIDVREAGELPSPGGFQYQQIPWSRLKENISSIEPETIVVFCQTGKRSLLAAQFLLDKFGHSKKIYSLQGGILNWLKNKTTSDE